LAQAVEAEVTDFLGKYADLKTADGHQRVVRHGHLPEDAAGLSASAIGRLKDGWLDEHTAWQRRDLSAKRYVYIWADGIHLQARLEDEKQCILVLIGATPEGRKELVGFTDGARESAQDWRDLLLDLKRRGLDVPPRLAIADGALGFWKAAGEVWPKTREQRCWVHKTANVIAKLPKSQQPKAKRALQEIWMAETKAAAELAFDAFIESYTPKYEKAADCLSKDRDTLLAFYDFPAEHWKHLRTTNPIESTFAIRSKGACPIPRVWRELDQWLRHRLRAIQLKQWKRGTTMYRELLALGAKLDVARQVAANSRRWWRNSGMLLNAVLTLNWSDRLGMPRLS
jgi:transposase-like protein